jgi:hypothetical protein
MAKKNKERGGKKMGRKTREKLSDFLTKTIYLYSISFLSFSVLLKFPGPFAGSPDQDDVGSSPVGGPK